MAGFPKRITVRASCPVPGCTASLLVSGAVAARLGAAGEPPGPGSQGDADRHLKRTGHPVTVVSRPEVPEQPYDRTVLTPPTEP